MQIFRGYGLDAGGHTKEYTTTSQWMFGPPPPPLLNTIGCLLDIVESFCRVRAHLNYLTTQAIIEGNQIKKCYSGPSTR
jgi:hypothetical protein